MKFSFEISFPTVATVALLLTICFVLNDCSYRRALNILERGVTRAVPQKSESRDLDCYKKGSVFLRKGTVAGFAPVFGVVGVSDAPMGLQCAAVGKIFDAPGVQKGAERVSR